MMQNFAEGFPYKTEEGGYIVHRTAEFPKNQFLETFFVVTTGVMPLASSGGGQGYC